MSEFSILQVEDEAKEVSFQQEAFRRTGICNPVQVVTDGQQAIDYLAGREPFQNRRRYPLPGLVLLKLRLPRQPGLEVLQWIRAQPSLRALVVIVLSPARPESDLARAYELGANSCVLQPATWDEWVELARGLKAWWLYHNLLAPTFRQEWRRAGVDIRASRPAA